MRLLKTTALFLVSLTAASAAAQAEPRDPFAPTGARAGRIIFRTICATCHGGNARGGGPLADSLKMRPPDLTRLTERNGGAFPAAAVAARIDGREYVEVHGSSEMPVWGDGLAYAVTDPDLREARVQNAIGMLVEYLETIQRSSPPSAGEPGAARP